MAVTIGLLISLPFAYLFLIWKTQIPKPTVAPVFLLSLLLAWSILPPDNRLLLEILTAYALPVAEAAVIIYVTWIVVRTRKKYGLLETSGNDLAERLRKALVDELSIAFVARGAAFELSLIYYVFGKWRTNGDKNAFSYYRSGVLNVGVVLIFLLVIETLVVHLVVDLWSSTVAWIITALSAYFGFQFLAHLKAIFLRPVEIGNKTLNIRCGMLGDAEIPLNVIDRIEAADHLTDTVSNALVITPLGGVTQPNIAITTLCEHTINGIYGIVRRSTQILIRVDEPEHFIAELRRAASVK